MAMSRYWRRGDPEDDGLPRLDAKGWELCHPISVLSLASYIFIGLSGLPKRHRYS